jgi:hypothetical protein
MSCGRSKSAIPCHWPDAGTAPDAGAPRHGRPAPRNGGGRRLLLRWPPNYSKLVLDPGDEQASHIAAITVADDLAGPPGPAVAALAGRQRDRLGLDDRLTNRPARAGQGTTLRLGPTALPTSRCSTNVELWLEFSKLPTKRGEITYRYESVGVIVTEHTPAVGQSPLKQCASAV